MALDPNGLESAWQAFNRPGHGFSWNALEAAISAYLAATAPAEEEGWRTIESAPVRKTALLCREGETMCVAAYRASPVSPWRHAHSEDVVCFDPTHWQPLPAPSRRHVAPPGSLDSSSAPTPTLAPGITRRER